MIKIGVTGACGKMGLQIRDAANTSSKFEISAFIERPGSVFIGEIEDGIEIVSDLRSAVGAFDVLIDFSTPRNSLENLEICASSKKPVVVGTTGIGEDFYAKAKEVSTVIPVLVSPNMSIGVNALYEIIKAGVKVLSDYDIEIVEHHHRNKIDAPSGTAKNIARVILDATEKRVPYDNFIVYDRTKKNSAREEGKIGIQSVRAGDIVGHHEVIFAANNEVIKISHTAGSRKIFALGALRAAEYVFERKQGLYDMSCLLGL